MSQKVLNVLAQAAKEKGLTPQQYKAFVATSKVESGLRPDAVGDNGTSYGLFQHHVGGAGGSSHQSARRYLDPLTSARERAQWFKKNNITTGAGAASLQRPADPSGYARKVNAVLGGGGPVLNAPVLSGNASASTTEQTSTDGAAQSYTGSKLFDEMWGDDPIMKSFSDLRRKRLNKEPAAQAKPTSDADSSQIVNPQGPVAKDYLQLQAEGMKLFGLRNDAGNSQLTGGRHTAGSAHYAGQAVDFGTAKNTKKQLQAWMKYAKSKGYDVLDEGDHIHVSTPGGKV